MGMLVGTAATGSSSGMFIISTFKFFGMSKKYQFDNYFYADLTHEFIEISTKMNFLPAFIVETSMRLNKYLH